MIDADEPVMLVPEPPGPRVVSRFEFNLLRILKFILGQFPAEQATGLIQTRHAPAPHCLSRNCVQLVKDHLSKGLVQYLVRSGGWRRDRFLNGQKPVEGRVWERLPLQIRQLTFSRHPLTFLIWLTAERPTDPKETWELSPGELTAGDELFFAMALDAIRSPMPDVFQVFSGKPAFRQNPLCWLFSPADFARAEQPEPPVLAGYFKGTRATILECLQPVLHQRWVRAERSKGQIADWRTLRQYGEAESITLARFLAEAGLIGRTDLARFILKTAATILGNAELTPAFWTGGLQGSGPPRLADRLEAQRAALALPRHIETLQNWDRRARTVRHFDDEYASSQLWLAEWEAAKGDELAARARRVIDLLEPLRT